MSGGVSKRYLLPFIWAVLIVVGSSIPNLSGLDTRITVADKIIHFAEYFILGYLTARAFLRLDAEGWGRIAVLIVILAAFAVLDELHQAVIPGRTADMLDMAADVFGALTSIMLYSWLAGRKTVRKEQV